MSVRLKEQGFNNSIQLRHDEIGNYLDFNGHRIYSLTIAIEDGDSTTVGGSTAPRGSIATSTNVVGRDSIFIAGSSAWVEVIDGGDVPVVAIGAEVDAGVNDDKFISPLALADSNVIPVVATGAEVNTGTDDAKFVSAKAIADSTIPTEVADAAETNTGTDDDKFISPKALADSREARAEGTPVAGDFIYFRTAAGVEKKIDYDDLKNLITA